MHQFTIYAIDVCTQQIWLYVLYIHTNGYSSILYPFGLEIAMMTKMEDIWHKTYTNVQFYHIIMNYNTSSAYVNQMCLNLNAKLV